MNNRKLLVIVLIVIVYIVSTGISYALFSRGKSSAPPTSLPKPSQTSNGRIIFEDNLPKTESCPLNGVLYSKQQRAWWERHRPLGVMIENNKDARPQSGLSFADIVYEAVAEGGITRFLAVYNCQDAGEIGPIRSARTYFMDFLSEYGDYPLYTHVGGANQPGPADALSQLTDYGWTGYNDLNQFSIGFPVFWRDSDRLGRPVATEHTMYSETAKLWDYAKTSRGLTDVDKNGNSWDKGFVSYSFKDDVSPSKRQASQTIHLEFWGTDPNYYVDWTYDPITNLYNRNNGKESYIDRDTNKQLTSKNIVVLFMQQSYANDGYIDNEHLLYKTKGIGRALIFMDGKEIKGTWRKDGRTSKTLLFDNSGKPVEFNRGKIWFEILPTDGVANVY